MYNFVTAATNLMVGALSGGDSIAKYHTARVFQHSSIETPRHNFSVCACNELYAKRTNWPSMMFTNALNRTNNNQISRDFRIESGSGVNSRQKGSRKLETT